MPSHGVEVWFDQDELRGGDAWDQKILRQIKACALFAPVISANTQTRREGYFRREWKLAVDRTHDMDEALPFPVPVVIDDTRDAEAFVPEKFREVQWTRQPNGETSTAFCAQVEALLRGVRVSLSVAISTAGGTPALPGMPVRRWLLPAVLGVVAVLVVAIWRPWRRLEIALTEKTVRAPTPLTDAATAAPVSLLLPRLARRRSWLHLALLDNFQFPLHLCKPRFLAQGI